MDKTTAQRTVRETFKAAFDKKRYRDFINELCNGFNEAKAQHMRVPDAFAPHIKSCQRLGTFESAEGELADVLIVQLTESYKLERTRTALRDFVAHKLKRGDGEDNSYKEAGLVAFVAPDSQSWRFSFVRMEYETKRDPKTGKFKPEERLTPARRYSYLVGADEECHTAQSRFLPLLQNTTAKPALSQIEEAFSVESVTKEFFDQYAALFTSTQEALDAIVKKDAVVRADFSVKKVSTADFTKKLLGQIVFLYFVQKKGWLGVPKGGNWGDGPRNFMRQLADRAIREKKCLFNDILEPLFYDTLATDRGHDAWCKTFQCRIPFLNGGLFEPLAGYDWENTNIRFPNSLFSNQERTSAEDTGSGILDVFDRYNFTVNEAEPLEKEVAIDPEMLGKVFENLIEENRRKGLGAFYTPREIVYYMCQESLINYLDTTLNRNGRIIQRAEVEALIREGEQAAHYEAARKDGTVSYSRRLPEAVEKHARALDEALQSITVCDPAIGSGAFPVGMMTEIVRARTVLTPYFNNVAERTAYHFKRQAIQRSLYGVDIDAGAVEIAKLRLWLSLVVDEEDVQQIKPLPNLDYKIVVGNSLLGVEKNLFNNEQFKLLEELKPKFFNESDREKKAQFKKQIEELIYDLTNGYEAFDFEIYFSEVFHEKGGFDVVIANPPYVRQEAIKELKPALKSAGYECFTGTADLLVYFYERGVKLLHGGGTITLITSNKFYRAAYGEKLRGFLARELTLQRLIDFGDAPVFEAIAYASILTGMRAAPAPDANALAYTWEKEMPFERIAQIVPERGQQIHQSELKPDGWQLKSPLVQALRRKIESVGIPLGRFVRELVFNGIKSGHKNAFTLSSEQRHHIVVNEPGSIALLKPLLKGRDIKRWKVKTASRWLLYIPWHFPYNTEQAIDPSSNVAEVEFRKRFPKVFAHLTGFRDELVKRDQSEIGIRYEWFCLSRPRVESAAYFDSPKIVFPDIAVGPSFAWDDLGHAVENTAYFIPAQKWLLAVLNSQAAFWFFRQISNTIRGGFVRFIRQYVEQIPIPAVTPSQQKSLERLVERILMAKQRDAGVDVSAWERQIDELVYALYGLTPEEIELVESAAK